MILDFINLDGTFVKNIAFWHKLEVVVFTDYCPTRDFDVLTMHETHREIWRIK